MRVFITGATGFIGRALTLRLQRDGHRITALVRNKSKARGQLGPDVELVQESDSRFPTAMQGADVVFNLAGEPLIGKRWNSDRKASIRKSRVDLTNNLVDYLPDDASKTVLISTSAVGYYGNGGDTVLTEESPRGTGFLATLCDDWENAAVAAEGKGARVAIMRIGVVLGQGGGALGQMLLPFKTGVGGPVGSGNQYVPWIHLHDLVEMFIRAMEDDTFRGPLNATAPNPVPFSDFAKALGKQLHRPAILPAPEFALRLLFGDAAQVLVEGQRAIPVSASNNGFEFTFESIEAALKDILSNPDVAVQKVVGEAPESEYLEKRPPKYTLKTTTSIPFSLDEVFNFFSQPENLGLLTPPDMQFTITNKVGAMEEGAIIDYDLKLGPMPISWRTRIDLVEDQVRFVDSQLKGPYASWWHEHHFEEKDGITTMSDTVYYAPPVGLLGDLANSLFIAGQLKEVFGYRSGIMKLRFNAS